MTTQEMKKELNTYLKHIRIINNRYIALMSIYNSIQKYNEEINYARGFFWVSIYAISDSCCSELVKLYCGSRHERTIRYLLGVIKANQNLFYKEIKTNVHDANDHSKILWSETEKVDLKREIDKAYEELDKLNAIIIRLKSRRNQYLAHNDPEYFYDTEKISKNLPLSLDELKQLIHFAGDLCNKMQGYLDGDIVLYETIGSDDLLCLFQTMHELRISDERKFTDA